MLKELKISFDILLFLLTLLFIPASIAFTISVNASQDNILNLSSFTQEQVNSIEDIYIDVESSLNGNILTFSFHNGSKQTIFHGHSYTIDVFIDGTWYQNPNAKKSFLMPKLVLSPGEEYAVALSVTELAYKSYKTYRFIKTFTVDSSPQKYIATTTFDLTSHY